MYDCIPIQATTKHNEITMYTNGKTVQIRQHYTSCEWLEQHLLLSEHDYFKRINGVLIFDVYYDDFMKKWVKVNVKTV